LQDFDQPFIEVKVKHCFCSDISKSNQIHGNKRNAASGPIAVTNRSIEWLNGPDERGPGVMSADFQSALMTAGIFARITDRGHLARYIS
jgi:hypothetical protein